MTPSCPSSRRRSSGRWRRSTEIWEQEDETELQKVHLKRGEHSGRREIQLCENEREKVERKGGAMCDRR